MKSMSLLLVTVQQESKIWSEVWSTDENNSDRSSVLKRRLNRAFEGKKRSWHVYKMHRRAVEHDDRRLFITRELRRSLSYSRWYIDIYLQYVRHVGKMLLRASVETFRWEFRMLRRVSVPGRHRLVMTFQVNQLSIIIISARTALPIRRKELLIFLLAMRRKRRNCILLTEVNTWVILGSMNSGVRVDQSRKIFHESRAICLHGVLRIIVLCHACSFFLTRSISLKGILIGQFLSNFINFTL